MTTIQIVLLVAIVLVAGLVFFYLGWSIGRRFIRAKLAASHQEAERVIADARKEAESIHREKMLELKDEQLQLRGSLEAEIRQKQDDVARMERSLKDREQHAKVRAEDLDKKIKEADRLVQSNTQREKTLLQKQTRIDSLEAEGQAALERVAGLTKEQALEELKESLLDRAREGVAEMIKEMRDRARLTANKEAKEVVISAIQRSAADHAVESTVSVVPIPNDEIKGRIIGREGRNIRAFEQATGVDIIVDDTPEAVIISAFDPLRREIARMALERLDGRRPHSSRPHRGTGQEVRKGNAGAARADRRSRLPRGRRQRPARRNHQAPRPPQIPHKLWSEHSPALD